jgi:YVTN family beta-propeller protein
MQNLNKVLKDVPKELLPLFEDYWKLHHQKLKPTLFPFRAHILGAANNKLYWFDESSVSIFDPKRNKIIETIETEKYRWKRMVMTPSGHKLYIANAGEIILIDSATNRSRELRVNARELCLSGDKLYANPYNGDIKVIDTATDRVISEGQLHLNGRRIVVANHKLYGEIGSKEIAVLDLATNQNAPNIVLTEQIVSLSSAGNKIYVGHYDGKISVIDATTDKVIATLKAGDQPNKMLLVGTILFVANYVSSSISIIDTTLDQIVGEPIATARGPSDMAFQNGKLYVNVLPDIRDYPDKIEYFNVDMPFLEKHLSAYYSK